MKHTFIFLILFCAYSLGYAQNKNKTAHKSSTKSASNYSKTESGLEYKIIKDAVGKNYPETGGFITFWFELKTDKDSILESQFSDPRPVGISTPEITFKPSIEEGFRLLTEGDSAVFLLNADTLYLKTFQRDMPSSIASGSKLKMVVKMDKVYSKHFVDSVVAIQQQDEVTKLAEGNLIYKRDSMIIQDYLRANNLKGEMTPGGAAVVKIKTNALVKETISNGETIQASYIGKLLEGESIFDQSPAGEYFSFQVGIGQVIRGWDEGFLKLKHGEKALILIPSRLAYGSRGAGGAIPPNAPLLFEVEVK